MSINNTPADDRERPVAEPGDNRDRDDATPPPQQPAPAADDNADQTEWTFLARAALVAAVLFTGASGDLFLPEGGASAIT